MIKNSRQRTAVLKILRGTVSHPTADWVYDKVREEIPNISLGTIYRNLARLTEAGELQRLEVGDGVDHFDANTQPHYHLYCEQCGRLLDLDMPYDLALNQTAQSFHTGQINWHCLVFYGLCGCCCEK